MIVSHLSRNVSKRFVVTLIGYSLNTPTPHIKWHLQLLILTELRKSSFLDQLPLLPTTPLDYFTLFSISFIDKATPSRDKASCLTYAELPFYGLNRLRCVVEIHVEEMSRIKSPMERYNFITT